MELFSSNSDKHVSGSSKQDKLPLNLRLRVLPVPEKPFASGSPNAVQVPETNGSKCYNNELRYKFNSKPLIQA